eukprot:jgi/Mesvir1/4038/Mv20911-RA.1
MSKFLSMTLRLRLASSASSRRSSFCCWILGCDGRGGRGGVLLKHVRPGRDGRSIAGQASGGWLGGNVLHRLGGEACGVLQDLNGDGVVLEALVDVAELGGDGVGGPGVVAVEEARRVEVVVDRDGGEEGKLGSQRAAHGRHICSDGGHVLREGLLKKGARMEDSVKVVVMGLGGQSSPMERPRREKRAYVCSLGRGR